MSEKKMFVTEEHFHAPCHMPMCHNVIKWSIHDLEGRPQTGHMVCDECLRGIVEAGAKALGYELVGKAEVKANEETAQPDHGEDSTEETTDDEESDTAGEQQTLTPPENTPNEPEQPPTTTTKATTPVRRTTSKTKPKTTNKRK